MSSPIRSLVNLLAFASIIGVLFWRENGWQTRLQQASARPAAPDVPKEIYTAGRDETMSLRVEAEVLRKKLAEAETRLSALVVEAETLKKAVQTAKPRPTQGMRTETQKIGLKISQWAYDEKKVLRSCRLFTLNKTGQIASGVFYDGKKRPLGSAGNIFDPKTGQLLKEEVKNREGQLIRILYYPGALKEPRFADRMLAFHFDPKAKNAPPQEVLGTVQPILSLAEDNQTANRILPRSSRKKS
jgi:hypothetical protein